MTIDIERLKRDRAYWYEVAPEGAEIYGWCGLFSKWLNGVEMVSEEGDSEWVASIASWPKEFYVKYHDAIPRPEPATEWDGEGLPPVGCECKVSVLDQPRIDAVVCAYSGDKVWLYAVGYGDIVEKVNSCKFSPKRTKEELARDSLREIIRVAYLEGATTHIGGIEAAVDAIIAAGWQKPE